MKSGFPERGRNVCLNYFSEVDGTICKDNQFQNHFQPVLADNTFGPTSPKQISVLLIKDNVRLYWTAQVLFQLHIETTEVKYNQQETAFEKCFDMTLPLDKISEILKCICPRGTKDDKQFTPSILIVPGKTK